MPQKTVYVRGMRWGTGKQVASQLASNKLTCVMDASKVRACDYVILGDDTDTVDKPGDLRRRGAVLRAAVKLSESDASKAKNPGLYRKKCEAKAFLAIYANASEIGLTAAQAGSFTELEKLNLDSLPEEEADPTPVTEEAPLSAASAEKRAASSVAVSMPQDGLYAIAEAIRQNAHAIFINSVIRAEASRCGQGGRAQLADSVLADFKASYENKEAEVDSFLELRDKKESLEQEQKRLEDDISKKQLAIEQTEKCDLPEETKDELLEESRKKVGKMQKRLELVVERLAAKRAEYDKQSDRVAELREDSKASLKACTAIVGELPSPQMHQLAKRPRWDVEGLLSSYAQTYQPPGIAREISVPRLDFDEPDEQPTPAKDSTPEQPPAAEAPAAPAAAPAPAAAAAPAAASDSACPVAAGFMEKLAQVSGEQ